MTPIVNEPMTPIVNEVMKHHMSDGAPNPRISDHPGAEPLTPRARIAAIQAGRTRCFVRGAGAELWSSFAAAAGPSWSCFVVWCCSSEWFEWVWGCSCWRVGPWGERLRSYCNGRRLRPGCLRRGTRRERLRQSVET